MRTRYFYDLEFLEDGVTIDPLSLGIVADDGREYYAVNRNADWQRAAAHPWLAGNVLPHLPGAFQQLKGQPRAWVPDFTNPAMRDRAEIAAEVAAFLTANSTDWNDNELWAYYAAYDHVALCQLWGPMMQLPAGVPMWTNDLQQEAHSLERAGVEFERPAQTDEHHALADAWWNATLYDTLRRVSATL